jgi:hypothetical protein
MDNVREEYYKPRLEYINYQQTQSESETENTNNLMAQVNIMNYDNSQNIFTNSFGHSKCNDGTFGNSRNECRVESVVNGIKTYSDSYLQIARAGVMINYQAGNKVKEISFFEKLQKRLRSIITVVLVLSMSFFGFKLLVGKIDLENRKLVMIPNAGLENVNFDITEVFDSPEGIVTSFECKDNAGFLGVIALYETEEGGYNMLVEYKISEEVTEGYMCFDVTVVEELFSSE